MFYGNQCLLQTISSEWCKYFKGSREEVENKLASKLKIITKENIVEVSEVIKISKRFIVTFM